MKIVIIEDEIELTVLMRTYIEKKSSLSLPSTVQIAHTLKTGRSLIEDLLPDWVIIDNHLPDGEGITMLACIKREHPQTKIIMMSALSNYKEEALQLGADYFLSKPISLLEIGKILGY